MQTVVTREYKNSFYNSKYQDSKPVIQPNTIPIEYNGFLIYKRSKDVFDIVKDNVCLGMYAGINGAKKAIDNNILIQFLTIKNNPNE